MRLLRGTAAPHPVHRAGQLTTARVRPAGASVQPQRHHPSPELMPPCTSGTPYARSAKEEPMPPTTAHHPDPPHHTPGPDRDCDTWRRALDALRKAGAQAGRDAADWWEQDTLGGRASGHTT